MISPDGWLDWAERVPGHVAKQNGGVNPVKGIFLHSAEGYEPYLRSHPAQATGVSWHLSNLFDGRLLQHYSLLCQCWHATAANNRYIGMEHEGRVPNDPSLTDAQVATARRVIAEIADWRGWTPSRPTSPQDTSHTLWEHNEVVRLGGTGSACPSGRIPWDKILAAPPQEDDMANLSPDGSQRIVAEGPFIVVYNGGVAVMRYGSTDGMYPGRQSKRFGGDWLWFRTLDDQNPPNLVAPYWSPVEGD